MSKLTPQQLQIELEKAATSLLTDDEIVESLGITQEELLKNYVHVSRARTKLKQRLNAKRISDAATNGKIDEILNNIPRNVIQYKGEGHGSYTNKASGRGGAREGAGRKTGSTTKITGASILRAIEEKSGDTFENLLAQGYLESIQNRDKNTRLQYEKLFLSKVVSDKVDVSYENLTTEQIQEKLNLIVSKFSPAEEND